MNRHYLEFNVPMCALFEEPTIGMNSRELDEYNMKCQSYEPDFGELEQVRTKEEYMSEVTFISKEQQKTNFEFYTQRVRECVTYEELRAVGQEVRDAQAEYPGKYFFFEKGKSREFWDTYRNRRDEINLDKKNKISSEYQECIKKAEDLRELAEIRQAVYEQEYFPYEGYKQVLFEQIKTKQQEFYQQSA